LGGHPSGGGELAESVGVKGFNEPKASVTAKGWLYLEKQKTDRLLRARLINSEYPSASFLSFDDSPQRTELMHLSWFSLWFSRSHLHISD
ncbi:MAG: hypothetical protein ACKO5E_03815, partial [bacterium]